MIRSLSAGVAIAMLATPALAAGSKSGDQSMTSTQQEMQKKLEQAGFRNVQIIDGAYLVRAQTQDGGTVWMTVDTDPMSGSAGSSKGTGQGSGSTDMTSPRPPYGSPQQRVGNGADAPPPSNLPDNTVPYQKK